MNLAVPGDQIGKIKTVVKTSSCKGNDKGNDNKHNFAGCDNRFMSVGNCQLKKPGK